MLGSKEFEQVLQNSWLMYLDSLILEILKELTNQEAKFFRATCGWLETSWIGTKKLHKRKSRYKWLNS